MASVFSGREPVGGRTRSNGLLLRTRRSAFGLALPRVRVASDEAALKQGAACPTAQRPVFFPSRAEGGLRLGCWRKRRILEYACHVVFVGRWWTHLWRFACSTRWPALFFFFFLTGFVKPEKARGTVIAGLHRHMQGAAVTGHRFIGSIVAHRSVVSGRNGFAGGIRQLFASTCAKR